MKLPGYALCASLLLMILTACGGGSNNNASTALLLSWPSSSQAVTVAYMQSVAFRNHTAMAWGNNGFGQLGNGDSGNSLVPVPVTGLPRMTGIVTGGTHSLSFRNLSGVWAWGNNGYGQLGNGTTTATYKPVKVFRNSTSARSYLTNVTAVAAGGSHSLALDASGTVWAWGANTWGQTGYDTSLGYSLTAKPVLNLPLGGFVATRIAAGGGHSLALDAAGTVWSWGNNYAGQLGDGTAVNRSVPVQVVGTAGSGVLQNVTAIAAGGSHTLALLADGSVVAWGYNTYGQLGNGTLVSSSIPVTVTGLGGVVAVAAGLDHSLALKSDGTVWAWGYNASGQLGTGSVVDRLVPVQVQGLSAIDRILAVGHHSLAFSGVSAWAWGDNTYGQAGISSRFSVYAPTRVFGY